jgi:hypothetical protein
MIECYDHTNLSLDTSLGNAFTLQWNNELQINQVECGSEMS